MFIIEDRCIGWLVTPLACFGMAEEQATTVYTMCYPNWENSERINLSTIEKRQLLKQMLVLFQSKMVDTNNHNHNCILYLTSGVYLYS